MCQPESPYYHLKNGHVLEAESALQILRRKQNVKGELESMKKHVEEDIMYEPSWSDIFYSRGNRKALAIILGVYTIQQFCGSTAIIVYAQQIFGQAKGGIRAEEACILFGSVQVLTSVISSALVDRLGRKPLLLVSCTGVGLSNLIVALYFTKSYAIPSYVTQFSIVVFISAYTIGLATVPFAITSEMFPTNVKALATCIIQTFTAIITFTVTKLYQVIADNVGTHVVFWVFTLFSLSGILFISILLPETKGQSFDTIQKRLNFKPTKLSTKDGNQQELS